MNVLSGSKPTATTSRVLSWAHFCVSSQVTSHGVTTNFFSTITHTLLTSGYVEDSGDISTSNAAAGRFSPQDLMTRGFSSPMIPTSFPSDTIAPHLPDRKLGCSVSLIWNDRPLFFAMPSKEERISVNPAFAWIVTAPRFRVSWIGWI